MAQLQYITIDSEVSSVLARKLLKLDSLLADYLVLFERETDIDDNLLLSGKERRHLLEDLYNDLKILDSKIGKIWDTLSPAQQVTLWNNTRSDLQFVYDGF